MIPVEGHKNLFRDKSGAIINTDANGYANYMKAKNKKLRDYFCSLITSNLSSKLTSLCNLIFEE